MYGLQEFVSKLVRAVYIHVNLKKLVASSPYTQEKKSVVSCFIARICSTVLAFSHFGRSDRLYILDHETSKHCNENIIILST